MKYFKLFLFIYAGFVISSFLIFYFGNEGIVEYKKLCDYKIELEKNLKDLKEINGELADRLKLLRRDPDINKVEARKLGLIAEGERLIKIDGYKNKGQLYKVGKLFNWSPPKSNRNLLFKYIGIVMPVLLFIIFGLIGFFKRSKENGT